MLRRGQSAQANIAGLSGCRHCVFLLQALLRTSSPTNAATAIGCASKPSSVATLLLWRGQSAQANIEGLSGCRHCVFLLQALLRTSSPTNAATAIGCASKPSSVAALLLRRGQSAQANIAGLSGCRHCVFLLQALLDTSSPTNAATAIGCASKPSSVAALLLRRGQSAQANIAGLSGCRHCVFLLQALLDTSSPTNAATAIGCASKPSSVAALLLRRGQSAQANIEGLSGCRHCVFLLQALLGTSSPTNAATAIGCASKPSSVAALLLRRGQSAQANIEGLSGCRHCVFLLQALLGTSSPINAATAIGCASKPSSVAALLLRRGQSAQANIEGLSGCRHCVFLLQALLRTSSPTNAATAIGCASKPSSVAALLLRRGQSAQANIEGLSGCRHCVLLAQEEAYVEFDALFRAILA